SCLLLGGEFGMARNDLGTSHQMLLAPSDGPGLLRERVAFVFDHEAAHSGLGVDQAVLTEFLVYLLRGHVGDLKLRYQLQHGGDLGAGRVRSGLDPTPNDLVNLPPPGAIRLQLHHGDHNRSPQSELAICRMTWRTTA